MKLISFFVILVLFSSCLFNSDESIQINSELPIVSGCKDVLKVHYDTIDEAHSKFLTDVLHWDGYVLDIRYNNPDDNSSCIDNNQTTFFNVDTSDRLVDTFEYGGPHTTFTYDTLISKPWDSNNSFIALQGWFNSWSYVPQRGNLGGGVNFGFFAYNSKLNVYINYVIGVYAAGTASVTEVPQILWDTTTDVAHVSTVMDYGTSYCTTLDSTYIGLLFKVPTSLEFKRVLVTYDDFKRVLLRLKSQGIDYGVEPSDWDITSIMLQAEVEESQGDGIISGVLSDFKVSKGVFSYD